MRSELRSRRLALAGLGAAVIACLLVIVLSDGSSYTLHARFADAGQLVSGGEVELAGRSVGTIAGISVTPDGLADVRLSVDDGAITPLHAGTRAIIRASGQASSASRFVQLIAGSEGAPALADGATLGLTQTTSIVDLDAVLDTFDPSTRRALSQLFAHSAQAFAGSGAAYFNQTLARLDPALGALDGLSGQLAGDRAALASLIRTGATATTALASRSTALRGAIVHTAAALGEVAQARGQLADALGRAPEVITQATGTLRGVATAVTALRPTLRELVPVAGPLRALLEQLPPALTTARPVLQGLAGLLPSLHATFNALPPLAPRAVRALGSTDTALQAAMPILTGVRIYGSDLVLGIFNGLGGLVSGPYNAVGHYAKINFVQSPQTLFAGSLSQFLSSFPLLPGVLGVRTHLLARCPGGDSAPAADGSSPWIPDPSLCHPADDVPASVNQP